MNSRLRRPICFQYGGKGHIASQCRDPLICFSCKRTGHKSLQCKSKAPMAGWFSDIGVGVSDEIQQRIDRFNLCGVVTILSGDCSKADLSSILQRKSGDHLWPFASNWIKDNQHFMVKCRTKRMLHDLCRGGFFVDGHIMLEMTPWTTTWGCHRRLGSGDPKWLQVFGLPAHGWSKKVLQEFFDMAGQVLEMRPSGKYDCEFIMARVYFDAHDWGTMPRYIDKRIGDAVFRIFIRREDNLPQRFPPQGIRQLTYDASSAVAGQAFLPPGNAPPPPQQAVHPPHGSPSRGMPSNLNPSASRWLEKGKWPAGEQPRFPEQFCDLNEGGFPSSLTVDFISDYPGAKKRKNKEAACMEMTSFGGARRSARLQDKRIQERLKELVDEGMSLEDLDEHEVVALADCWAFKKKSADGDSAGLKQALVSRENTSANV